MRPILFIILTLASLGLYSQENQNKSTIQVSSYIDNGDVLIRWAPTNSIDWFQGNKFGYSVYRKVVMRNGVPIQNVDSILVSRCFPLPIDMWSPFADSSYFAVAAEALYGKEFEVTAQSKTFFDLINRSKEQESRFSIGLLCADQSFKVACMMGLGLIDTTSKPNETYLYHVIMNSLNPSQSGTMGYAVLDFGYGNFTPRPFGVNPQINENVVTIAVPFQPFKGIYNTFEVQRSFDCKTFKPICSKSTYSLSTTFDDPQYHFYNDTINQKAINVYYRIRGRTPFDTYGPYSDTISVKVMPSLKGEPWIKDIKEIGKGKLVITWDSPAYPLEDLKGYAVYSSQKYIGEYTEIQKSTFDSNNKTVLVDTPDGFAYFRIGALDQFNRPYLSIPKLYQALDSIPPSQPKGLKGSFDSTGVVKFNWSYGKERDLLGYQILYTVNPDFEYSLVSKDFIYDSTFQSAFPISMLSSNLYFKIVALDTRYNTSKASESIKLIKPDNLSPSAPLIMLNKDSLGLIVVMIAPSHSTDVVSHTLYFINRKEKADSLVVFKGSIKCDTTIAMSNIKENGYLICIAEDNTSRKGYSPKIPFNISNENIMELIKVAAIPNVSNGFVEVIWDKNLLDDNLMIYRKDDFNSYRLIATVEARTGIYKDRNVTINVTYTYRLVSLRVSGKFETRIVQLKYK